MPRVVHVELSLWMCSIPSLSTSDSKSLSLRTVLRSFWCSSHLALRTTWNTLVRQSSEVTPSWDPKVTCLSCARAKLGVLGWVCSRDIWFLALDFGGLLFLSKRFRQCQFGLPMCFLGRSDLTKNFTCDPCFTTGGEVDRGHYLSLFFTSSSAACEARLPDGGWLDRSFTDQISASTSRSGWKEQEPVELRSRDGSFWRTVLLVLVSQSLGWVSFIVEAKKLGKCRSVSRRVVVHVMDFAQLYMFVYTCIPTPKPSTSENCLRSRCFQSGRPRFHGWWQPGNAACSVFAVPFYSRETQQNVPLSWRWLELLENPGVWEKNNAESPPTFLVFPCFAV